MSTIVAGGIRKSSMSTGHDPLGVASGWLNYNQATPAITADVNITSVTDTAAGIYDATFTTNTAAATYAVTCGGQSTAAAVCIPIPMADLSGNQTAPTTSGYRCSHTFNDASGSGADPNYGMDAIHGELA